MPIIGLVQCVMLHVVELELELVAWYGVTSVDGGLKFEVRLTAYSRQQKSKAQRNAMSTSCILLTVRRISTINANSRLQVR